MRSILFVLVATTLSAEAGRRDKQPPVALLPIEAAQLPHAGPLFPDGLPVDIGPLPAGLANTSAQGCRACHTGAHDNWTSSGHAGARVAAVAEQISATLDEPRCTSCHLPLTAQSEGAGATLRLEGVTCATCHVRDGAILTHRPESRSAPHPLAMSSELATGEVCAACHQLSWPGEDRPLYDTWGEWERSAYPEAGVRCTTCHDLHGPAIDPARALSVLIGVDRFTLTRGGEPVRATIRVQNTGAGHAVPTGSPFSAMELVIVLERDDSEDRVGEKTHRFGRTLSDKPPWHTTSDTRIPVGGEQSVDFIAGLPLDAKAGEWALTITLGKVSRDGSREPAFFKRRLSLQVD